MFRAAATVEVWQVCTQQSDKDRFGKLQVEMDLRRYIQVWHSQEQRVSRCSMSAIPTRS